MFVTLGEHLKLAGATYADVVELTSFHVAPKDPKSYQEEFARYAPSHHEFFRRTIRPPLRWVRRRCWRRARRWSCAPWR